METFLCPFCHSEYSVSEADFSPVKVYCSACHHNFLHYKIRNIWEPQTTFKLRAFVACGTREESERKVLENFRECLYQMGVLPRTVGAEPDLKASSQTEALFLAYNEIQKADFVLAVELRRYPINGYLPPIWTLGIEPIIGFLKGKPIYVFTEEGVTLEGPLPEIALEVIGFDRDLLNDELERNRMKQWLQAINEEEEERKARRRRQVIYSVLGVGMGVVTAVVAAKKCKG